MGVASERRVVFAVREQLRQLAAIRGVRRLELLRLAKRGDRARDVAASMQLESEKIVLEHFGEHRVREGIRRLYRHRELRFIARGFTEVAGEESAGKLNVMLRFFRMQPGELAELDQRGAHIACIQLRLSDRIEADPDSGALRKLADRFARLLELGCSQPPLTRIEP